MNALTAVDQWMSGSMTVEEVMTATGHDSKAGLLQEFLDLQFDFDAAQPITADEAEDEELERLAYELYQGFLAENPGYLGQLKDALKRKRQRDAMAFGAAFRAVRRGGSVHNVVRFRPRG